ncbi:MAG: DUF2284 domain-containing protein [Bacillota bacterium]|nr:DUF2284 domain-containing protein [Bacillota bacterium]
MKEQIQGRPDAKSFLEKALQMGASDAVLFGIDDIAFDSRTLLKCMFGCGDWGKNHTCPSRPGFPLPWDFEKILRRYSWGVIIHTHEKKLSHEISFGLEREAFLKGYYMAFSMSDCSSCEKCSCIDGASCRFPKSARPAFHSVGIDVFKTVHNLSLPLDVLQNEKQQQNWYSAVFIE